MTKKLAKAALGVLALVVLAVGLLSARIYSFRSATSDGSADAAVVLGAAVWTTDVSPVQLGLLAHETYYYLGYLLRRPFLQT